MPTVTPQQMDKMRGLGLSIDPPPAPPAGTMAPRAPIALPPGVTYSLWGATMTQASGSDVVSRWKPAADLLLKNVVVQCDPSKALDYKAVHITVQSPGVAVSVEGAQIGGLSQSAAARAQDLHTDGIKVEANSGTSVTLRNVVIRNCGPGVTPIHIVDGGDYDTIILDGVSVIGCINGVTIGGKAPIKRIIVRNCPGLRIGYGNTAGRSDWHAPPNPEVSNSTGANVFGRVYGAPAGETVPPPPPVTPSTPPPPVPAPAYDPLNDLRDLSARLNAIIAKAGK